MQEQEQDNNFESSSTDTSRSSPFETPEVNATGRPPLDNRIRKSTQQKAQIAELQAQLKTREEDFEKLQEQVLRIMTQESLTNPFPSTPTYVDVDGQLITKLQLLQEEMKAKEKTFRETMLALESHRHLQATIPLETPGPHRLQAKTPRPEDLLYQHKLQQYLQANA
jgi:ATP-dependent phosphoenolpyruvate carboxykinase